MSDFEFNPFGTKSVVIKFDCDACGALVDSEEIFVPSPDYSAEKASDSQVMEEGYAVCEQCSKQFEIDIYVTYAGATGEIRDYENNSSSISVIESMEDYDENELLWDIESTKQVEIYQRHIQSINNILTLTSKFDPTIEFSTLVMLHGFTVTAVESFLSSVFIHVVTNSDDLIIKFIAIDSELKKRRVSLKDIYREQDQLKITVANRLKSISFHNIDTIRPLFKSVMGYDFGNITWLSEAVLIRHDCVHRAGYNKDGDKVIITAESISDLITSCNELVQKIDSHVLSAGLLFDVKTVTDKNN